MLSRMRPAIRLSSTPIAIVPACFAPEPPAVADSARAGVGCPAQDPIFIVGMPRSGTSLVEQILASHALIHTADGELFRDSLRAACARFNLPVQGIREKELFATASKAFGVQPAALKHRIAAFGKSLGPPWSQDEKFAALGAWLSLTRQAVP